MPPKKDYTGLKKNMLTAIKPDENRPGYWIFECECGAIKSIRPCSVFRGDIKSCGCLRHQKKNEPKSSKNLVGKYFGLLKVIKYVGNSKYLCECKCGNLTEVRTCNLTNGHTKSCGCLAKKAAVENGRKTFMDLSNKQFGNLTAIKYIPEIKKWECKCNCGNVCYVAQSNLMRKNMGTRSCGCMVNLKNANTMNIVEQTNVGNIKSKKASSRSSTGIKGVYFSKTQGLYVAQIGFQGKKYYLISSTDINVCIAARKEAEKRVYGDFLDWYEEYKQTLKK